MPYSTGESKERITIWCVSCNPEQHWGVGFGIEVSKDPTQAKQEVERAGGKLKILPNGEMQYTCEKHQ